MAFFDLEDLTGRVEVVAFTSMYNKSKELFTKNNTVEIVGKLETQVREYNGEEIVTPKIILMKISPLKEGKKINKITIFPKENDDFEKIRDIIVSNSGDTPIEVMYQNALLKTNYRISTNIEALTELEGNCLTRREYAS